MEQAKFPNDAQQQQQRDHVDPEQQSYEQDLKNTLEEVLELKKSKFWQKAKSDEKKGIITYKIDGKNMTDVINKCEFSIAVPIQQVRNLLYSSSIENAKVFDDDICSLDTLKSFSEYQHITLIKSKPTFMPNLYYVVSTGFTMEDKKEILISKSVNLPKEQLEKYNINNFTECVVLFEVWILEEIGEHHTHIEFIGGFECDGFKNWINDIKNERGLDTCKKLYKHVEKQYKKSLKK